MKPALAALLALVTLASEYPSGGYNTWDEGGKAPPGAVVVLRRPVMLGNPPILAFPRAAWKRPRSGTGLWRKSEQNRPVPGVLSSHERAKGMWGAKIRGYWAPLKKASPPAPTPCLQTFRWADARTAAALARPLLRESPPVPPRAARLPHAHLGVA